MTRENEHSSARRSGRTFPERVREAATRGRLSLLGTVAVLVVGGTVAVHTVDTTELAASLRDANPIFLAGATVVYALSWPIRGRRYDDILGSMDHRCGVVFTTGAVFVSQTANLVVPARAGDGVRAYLCNTRRGIPYTEGAASLTAERLFDLLGLLALGGVALSWLGIAGDLSDLARATEFVVPAAIVGGVGVVLSILLIGSVRYDLASFDRFRVEIDESRLRWVVDTVCRFGVSLREVVTAPHTLGLVGVGTLVIWGLDVLTAVFVLAAVSGLSGLGTVEFLAVGTLAVTVGNLAKVLPLSQGGIGLYEAAFTALVVAVSPIGGATALAAAVLDHGIKNAVTALGGVAAALAFNVSPSSAEPESESVEF